MATKKRVKNPQKFKAQLGSNTFHVMASSERVAKEQITKMFGSGARLVNAGIQKGQWIKASAVKISGGRLLIKK